MFQDFRDTVCVYALNTLKTGDNLSITNYPITRNAKDGRQKLLMSMLIRQCQAKGIVILINKLSWQLHTACNSCSYYSRGQTRAGGHGGSQGCRLGSCGHTTPFIVTNVDFSGIQSSPQLPYSLTAVIPIFSLFCVPSYFSQTQQCFQMLWKTSFLEKSSLPAPLTERFLPGIPPPPPHPCLLFSYWPLPWFCNLIF